LISHTGKSISPNPNSVNFNSPVELTVTASDNSTQKYTVTVNVASQTDKKITGFSFNNVPSFTDINEAAKTITVSVPAGTNITNLTPTVIHTGKSYSPLGAQNFSSPRTYTVTDASNNTQNYTVNVITIGTKPITIENVRNGIATASRTSASPGTYILLTAFPVDGYKFLEWKIIQGGVEILYSYGNWAVFYMLDLDVKIEAHFEGDVGSEPGTSCEHNYSNWSTKTEATCIAAKVEKRTCSLCDDEDTQPIGEPLSTAHAYGSWSTKTEATCIAAKVEKRICSLCDDEDTQPIGEPLSTAHVYGSWTTKTEATCIAAKVEKRICSLCDDEDTQPIGEPLGHNFSSTTPATCTTDSKPGNCTHQGCDVTNPEAVVLASGHDHVSSLICKRTECNHQYEIGDTGPAGGKIFYVAPNGFTVQGYSGGNGSNMYLNFNSYTAYYLEAAPTNAVGGTGSQTMMRWYSTYPCDVTGTGKGIGSGRYNTAIIIATEKTVYPSNTYIYAALACDNYLAAGYESFTDWFLPSEFELIELMNIKNVDLGITTEGWFWSSTQEFLDFKIGVPFRINYMYEIFSEGIDGDHNGYIRPVRAF